MNKIWFCIAFLAICFGACAQAEDENAIAGQYIVQFYGDVNAESWFIGSSYRHDVLNHECLSKNMNIWLVRSGELELLPYFLQNKNVKAAQYNHGNVKRRSLVPNDSLFNLQWNMQNTPVLGADISATQAWQINHSNVTQTGDSIVIAIVDGGFGAGFDIYHPDLNFFVNKNEIPNNGIDDDGNGYIDDYHGWNIFTNSDSVYNVSDRHATHVSGIAAGIGNNGTGIAGVCWGAKILAVNGASTLESDVIKAYDYVIEMRKIYDQTSGAKGAFIVATNSSFGVDRAAPAAYPIWCAMYDTMGSYGILSVTATANSGWNVDQLGDIPTTCPSKWMIAVTNTTHNDLLNNQAAFGPQNIDIAAPGTSIMSCYPNGAYGYDNGTSMASPHVAGAVAAIFANACPRLIQDYFSYPDSMALVMKDYLLQSADPLASLHNKIASGRLNLYHAFLTEASYNCNNCNYNASLSAQGLSCYGDSSASISVSSSVGHVQYLWSNGATTAAISGLGAGFYQVTVTDSTGCQRQLVTKVTAPQQIVVSSITMIPMQGSNPGNIIISAAAGNDTMSYAIDTSSYQSSAIFVTTVTGAHTLHIKNQSGCVLDTVVYIFYSGIDENGGGVPVSVHPNPSNGLIYFDGVKSGSVIQLFDMLGQITYTGTIGKENNSIDLRGGSKGVYFYKVIGENGISHQGKIVVE